MEQQTRQRDMRSLIRAKSRNSHTVHLTCSDYRTLCGREVPETWSINVAEEVGYICRSCRQKAPEES